MDYLSQLLGSGNDKVKQLAQDISKFQKGESLSTLPSTATDNVATSAPPKAEPTYQVTSVGKKSNKSKKSKTPPRAQQPTTSRPAPKTPPRPKQTFRTKAGIHTSGAQPTFTSATATAQPTPAESAPPPPLATTHNNKPPPKSRPTRGTPKFVCGCFGTFHKPLANCLL